MADCTPDYMDETLQTFTKTAGEDYAVWNGWWEKPENEDGTIDRFAIDRMYYDEDDDDSEWTVCLEVVHMDNTTSRIAKGPLMEADHYEWRDNRKMVKRFRRDNDL